MGALSDDDIAGALLRRMMDEEPVPWRWQVEFPSGTRRGDRRPHSGSHPPARKVRSLHVAAQPPYAWTIVPRRHHGGPSRTA